MYEATFKWDVHENIYFKGGCTFTIQDISGYAFFSSMVRSIYHNLIDAGYYGDQLFSLKLNCSYWNHESPGEVIAMRKIGGAWVEYEQGKQAGTRHTNYFYEVVQLVAPPMPQSLEVLFDSGVRRLYLNNMPSAGDLAGQATTIAGFGAAAKKGVGALATETGETLIEAGTGLPIPLPGRKKVRSRGRCRRGGKRKTT